MNLPYLVESTSMNQLFRGRVQGFWLARPQRILVLKEIGLGEFEQKVSHRILPGSRNPENKRQKNGLHKGPHKGKKNDLRNATSF